MSECLPDLPRHIRQQGGEWQGADHPDGPWRSIPAPQPGLPWSVDPPAAGQRQTLSPVEELQERYHSAAGEYPDPDGLAAVIRALADQVVPAASSLDRATWSPFAGQIRSEILAIVAELEGADA